MDLYTTCWRFYRRWLITPPSFLYCIHTLDSDSLEGTRSKRMFPSKCFLVKTVATHEMYFVIFIKYCVFKKLSLYWYKGFFCLFLSVKKLLKKKETDFFVWSAALHVLLSNVHDWLLLLLMINSALVCLSAGDEILTSVRHCSLWVRVLCALYQKVSVDPLCG